MTGEPTNRPAYPLAFETFAGFQIFKNPQLFVTVEDWSRVRSIGRATRRRGLGHRQNIALIQIPDPDAYVVGGALHMHPETLRKMAAKINSEPTK